MSNHRIKLEQAALDFAKENEEPPFLYQLPVAEGRKTVDEAQGGEVEKLEASIEEIEGIKTPYGTVTVTLYRPTKEQILPALVYAHGGGWVFGNAHTHDTLMRELAVKGQQAVFFVNYSLSPEAKYPVALEEIYAVTKWVVDHEEDLKLTGKLTIGGDSAGGNMAIATALLAKERKGPTIHKQLLYYPVTDAAFDTDSYKEFARGYFLHRDGMKWFWKQYLENEEQRDEITVSPLRAATKQLRGMPATLLITGEADVLRDEGEHFVTKLREAGVEVIAERMPAMIHDFMMLHALAKTEAQTKALELTIKWLNK